MTIQVLFFGALTDVVGKQQQNMDVDVHSDVASLNSNLVATFPSLINFKYKIAVNKIIVAASHQLNEGDEVAFLPPFAGG